MYETGRGKSCLQCLIDRAEYANCDPVGNISASNQSICLCSYAAFLGGCFLVVVIDNTYQKVEYAVMGCNCGSVIKMKVKE